MKKRIAVIGAGISGLTLAHSLKSHADVVVYEKARGVGGRMSTRYADPFYFDHGTQYFTARTQAFQSFLKPYMEEGTVAEWHGKIINVSAGKKEAGRLWDEPHFVATPNMNSLCKKLSDGVELRLSTEVAPLTKEQPQVWALQDKQGNLLGDYDWVISTAPPAQTLHLFQSALPDDSPLHSIRMQGCYALMIGFNRPWSEPWIAARVEDNPLSWIAMNSTKPGRNNAVSAIVAHSSNDWADAHIDDDIQEAQQLLLKQFETVTGIAATNADYIAVHRWKYAIVEQSKQYGSYIDYAQGLAATSDWTSASRIEDVWLNAKSLAEQIINSV